MLECEPSILDESSSKWLCPSVYLLGFPVFFRTKLTCQLLRINMQNTCNFPKYKKQKNGKHCAKLEEGGAWGWSASFHSYGTVISPLLVVLFYPVLTWNWFWFQRQCLPSDRLLQGIWRTEKGAPAMSFHDLCYDYVMVIALSLQRLLLISLRTSITLNLSL